MVSHDLYPFEGQYKAIGGHRLHYLDEGAGEPVVMVHGNPTWSFYYRNLVLALRGQFRCIAPDHIGCGMSDKPGDDSYDYILEQRVSDLETLLDELGVTENINLVVHDWGGMIGMAYATKYPDRIKSMTVLNTSAFSLPKSKSFPWPLWLCRTPLGAFLIRGFNGFSAVASYECCKRNPMSKDLRTAYRAPYNSWKNRIATLRFVQDIPLKQGDRSFGEVARVESSVGKLADKPMLICWGLLDFIFDKHFLARWEEGFPDAQVHRYEDCGHYILEDAADEVIPLIQAFMEQGDR